MSIFTIADLHLSLNASTNKSMDVFGRRWQGYTEKLEKNWRAVVTDDDTVILPGDISWALSTEEAAADFAFLHSLPGKKLVGKGNHDFWWQTMRKLNAFTETHHFDSISFLFNNAFPVEDLIVTGTRGWFYDSSSDNIPPDTDFKKITEREAGRLILSLEEGKKLEKEYPEREIVVFLHFPVTWGGKTLDPLMDVLLRYGIRRCYFGHIHGSYDMPMEFEEKGVQFSLISADFLNFVPKIVQK